MHLIDPRQPDFTNAPGDPRRPRFEYAPAEPAREPLVSLVTPFHEPGEVFRHTVRSVLRQSLQDWEWIVVDDGSTSQLSRTLLAEASDADGRVRVLRHEANRGPGAARNRGVAAARGRYLLLLDADDLLEPTAAEKWLWYLESHPTAGFVKGYTVGFDGEHYLWTYGFHDPRRFRRSNQVQTASLIRRDAYRSAGGFDESIRGGLEDWDFWLRCAGAGHWGATVPEYLDWYRRRGDHSARWADWDDGPRQRAFERDLRRRHRRLFRRGFPLPTTGSRTASEPMDTEPPLRNRLRKSRPRVLLLVPWLTTGGAEKFALEVVGELVSRGWEVTVAATRAGEQRWLSDFAALTPDVFVMPHFLRLDDGPRFLRYLARSRDVDAILVTHSEMGYQLLPYLRAHQPGAAALDYCHIAELDWEDGGYPRYALRFDEWIDRHVVSSRHLADWLAQRGSDASRIAVATTNVDATLWRPDPEARRRVRSELKIHAATPVVLFAGRLVPQKQPGVLLGTLRRLARSGEQFVAVVAGDGPGLSRLRRDVARAGISSRVRCVGEVSQPRMRELMAAADVFLLPSRWEGISLALFEAMACGLAVVAADVGGHRELVAPGCGVLVPRTNPVEETTAYAEAVAPLLRDEAARRQLGEAARRQVTTEFGRERMGAQMHQILQAAVDLHCRSPRPAPDAETARAAATAAVAHARGVEAGRGWASLASEPRAARGLRRRLFDAVYRWHEPLYRWYSRRGWTWPDPLRARLRAWLGGGG